MNKKAIALHYNNDKDSAPKLLTKGRGEIAEKIIEIAESNGIPLYKDMILSEVLDKIDIGNVIPESLFEIIAEVYAFTYQIMRKD